MAKKRPQRHGWIPRWSAKGEKTSAGQCSCGWGSTSYLGRSPEQWRRHVTKATRALLARLEA